MADLTKLIEMHESVPDSGLYKVTQYLHDWVRTESQKWIGEWPESLQQNPATVIVEGFVGAYLLTRALQII